MVFLILETIGSTVKTIYIPRRYILVLLGSLGIFNVFAMRTNLSVAIVAMVNQTTNAHLPSLNASFNQVAECPNFIHDDTPKNSTVFTGEQFNWDTQTQGTILSAYFYGYVMSHVPGGILAEKFGAKWVFGGGVLATSVFTLLSPFAAYLDKYAFVAIRILQGLADGVTTPSITAAISKWAPKVERSRLSTIIFTGIMVGNVASLSVSGLLCSTEFLGGWPSVFYLFGALGVIWFFFWCFFIYETPSNHPTISKEEFLYIEQNKDKESEERHVVPWKDIFTSVPVWALMIAQFGQGFGFLILLTELPTYLSTALHFDLASNGFISAMAYVFQAVVACVSSLVADKLRESEKMSVTAIRKLFNSIGFYGPAICLLCITASGCRLDIIVVFLVIAIALDGSVYSGFNVTHVDMSPVFSGTLYGIANGFGCTSGFIGPMIAAIFTSTGPSLSNWSNVFYMTAGVYIFCATVFLLFGSAELQSWGTKKIELEEEYSLENIVINTKVKSESELILTVNTEDFRTPL
ncbi:sialin [Parasteatoda tepidariorum]|uniref:sialin n=1 Tax=Parasteatoda tepidariorum TaxID=114398 RepID=UPI001C722058|nr:sialin [Parasteatoda tepidariorum]